MFGLEWFRTGGIGDSPGDKSHTGGDASKPGMADELMGLAWTPGTATFPIRLYDELTLCGMPAPDGDRLGKIPKRAARTENRCNSVFLQRREASQDAAGKDEGGISMKKRMSIFLALLALSLGVLPAMADETIVIGVLSYLNITESEYNQDFVSSDTLDMYITGFDWLYENGYLKEFVPADSSIRHKAVFYNNIDALVLALTTGKIDLIDDLPQVTAEYLCAQNDQIMPLWLYDRERIEAEGGFAVDCFKTGGSGYSFLITEENQALCDAFNSAIVDMKADGTLDQLIQTHIFAAIAGEKIEPIAMDFVEGRETVRVAVTGSLPPMDYVAEDGSFAGFNTAILAEIGRRIDRNMEIIQVDSIGRAAALVSGTVDAVFWASSNPYGADERIEAATVEEFKARLMERHSDYTEEQVEILARMGAASDFQEDIPEHTIVTDPYFVDGIVGVGLKEKIPR